jgi:hypothetical protein
MVLTIESGISQLFLDPIEPPIGPVGDGVFQCPDWCTTPNSSISIMEIGSDNTWLGLKTGLVLLGRNDKSTVIIEDLYVSRLHAMVLHHFSGRLYLVDMNSQHGTFIGSDMLTPFVPTLVPDGALIRIGIYQNQFSVHLQKEVRCVFTTVEEFQQSGEAQVNAALNRSAAFQQMPSVVLEIGTGTDTGTGIDPISEFDLPPRFDFHRTATLDSDGLAKLQMQFPGDLPVLVESHSMDYGSTDSVDDGSDVSASDSLSSGEDHDRHPYHHHKHKQLLGVDARSLRKRNQQKGAGSGAGIGIEERQGGLDIKGGKTGTKRVRFTAAAVSVTSPGPGPCAIPFNKN